MPNQRTVIDTDAAREGVTGHGVRYVLGISLALAVIAGIVLGVAS